MKILVLGCGTSTGVPLIGCTCGVCTSANEKNKRLRPSVLVSENNFDILIDTAPDLRTQALKFNVKNIDAVLYTHTHADHIFGIDDLRMFNYLKSGGDKFIPIYASETSVNFIKDKFDYIFKEKSESSKPYLVPKTRIKNYSYTCFSRQKFNIRIQNKRFCLYNGCFVHTRTVGRFIEWLKSADDRCPQI
jgi:phosphoribosyl 1,2-cyclic phosphate phosphodiesterase